MSAHPSSLFTKTTSTRREMLGLSVAALLTPQIPVLSINAAVLLGPDERNLRGKIVLFGVHSPGRENVSRIQSLDRNG